ncbi:VPEID-CTERM sorting domain-containing protein [uncultured Roseobacter sp.]|uniref:VPEID-CTERM sorting domain-containing protein n=1 Tax=uncultured Roseobacter sp. TaxID=114847 RepID=UPI00260F71D0|nr:VPEID-CTERM sorting domain-containing protein [uncultured Roseobacter sp.]
MKTLLTAAAVSVLSAPAFAQACGSKPGDVCVTSVPEISALEGTAALAALAAIVLLAWERRRRAV